MKERSIIIIVVIKALTDSNFPLILFLLTNAEDIQFHLCAASPTYALLYKRSFQHIYDARLRRQRRTR